VYEQSPLGGDRFWPDGARPYPAQQCVWVSYVVRNMPNFSFRKKRRRDECEDDDVESTLRRPLASNIPNPMLSTCANCNREMSLVGPHSLDFCAVVLTHVRWRCTRDRYAGAPSSATRVGLESTPSERSWHSLSPTRRPAMTSLP
jgi:hypothetical protein